MSGRTKPRRYRPRPITLDPITLAMHRASKTRSEDIDAVLGPIRAAFKALREGVATELQWSVLASSVNVAMTIENQGVITGLGAHFKAAEQALQQIYLRAMDAGEWKPTAMYWQEIDAVDEFVPLHKFQLEQLSRGEVIRAMDKTEAVIRSGRGTVINMDQLRAHEQMQLIGAAA
jgi:hypothetical protein